MTEVHENPMKDFERLVRHVLKRDPQVLVAGIQVQSDEACVAACASLRAASEVMDSIELAGRKAMSGLGSGARASLRSVNPSGTFHVAAWEEPCRSDRPDEEGHEPHLADALRWLIEQPAEIEAPRTAALEEAQAEGRALGSYKKGEGL